MPQRYVDAIVKYLAGKDYQPLKPRQLARQLGVAEDDYGSFREAIKNLRDAGRVVLGAKNAVIRPEMANRIVGVFRANQRGFGFVCPETPSAHGDLYIPEGSSGGAMTGDTVVAQVFPGATRGGERMYHGKVVEIVRRGSSHVVGTLQCAKTSWFVLPDGKSINTPVVIADVGPGAVVGQKVVAEITQYPEPGEMARGVIVENLGAAGQIAVETQAIIRSYDLADEFSPAALDDARLAIDRFDATRADAREDLTADVIVTIDPIDARDFDDAISLSRVKDGWILGVHIADVSFFVAPGGPLDQEARQRGNSVYFPRRVVPMLPEVLSNGVCSLQQGQRRFCKSAFIRYDERGEVASTRLAETVISSRRRLNYQEAQAIIEGKSGGYEPEVVQLLARMNELARIIEKRRNAAGMLHLDLPKVELVLDEEGKVVNAVPEDQSYTHTIIEMFMVEANEAVAGAFDRQGAQFIRRIHPDPDPAGEARLSSFVKVCGHIVPRHLSRADIQLLLRNVAGRPESHAVNLAVLKSFQAAEYSPMKIGHFALASRNYCHFTSPIRRYADLTIHRLFAELVRGGRIQPQDTAELVALGDHLSMTERRAQNAEEELTTVLVLQLLAGKVGEQFEGVVNGVTNFGIFVELRQLGIDGLIRMQDLGDDWWELNVDSGEIRGSRGGKRFRVGDPLNVQVLSVNLPLRQLNLAPVVQRDLSVKPRKPLKVGQAKRAKRAQRLARRKGGKGGEGGKAKGKPGKGGKPGKPQR